MKSMLWNKISVAATAVLAVVFLILWLQSGPLVPIEPRVPGRDNAPTGDAALPRGDALSQARLIVRQQGEPAAQPQELPGLWPHFRGPDFDNVVKDSPPLVIPPDPQSMKVLWKIPLGEGYAAAAVRHGRVYVLDYDQENLADALRCLSLADGQEFWRFTYPVKIKRNHGMSRTLPAVSEEYVVALGPKCHVSCLEAKSGKKLWMLDLIRDFGTAEPLWYAGQCPLIEDGKAILAPGGTVLMMAVDCGSGQIVWQTPNPEKWQMTHSSIMPMDFAGRRMYVYCAGGGLVGVAADTGEVLWQTTAWKIRTNVPSPVIVGDGRIFLSGGYNKGSMMIQLKDEPGGIQVEILYELKPEVFGSDQQTPILYQDHLYGVRPDEQLVCLDLAGQVLWASGGADTFGLGPYLIADGRIFVLNDTGELTVVEATPRAYRPQQRLQVLDGHDCWGPITLVHGRMILRDLTSMVCLDLGGG
ncbi:MAG: PQQ-like beta-propeller repeat protein [Sedimentisphaerales bacterium]|nr:PQQ-like beta-propeller repeat protein [Sedimentisphaerales bacterium]